jgi:hypothetical protein
VEAVYEGGLVLYCGVFGEDDDLPAADSLNRKRLSTRKTPLFLFIGIKIAPHLA